jgi:hypothetical protein
MSNSSNKRASSDDHFSKSAYYILHSNPKLKDDRSTPFCIFRKPLMTPSLLGCNEPSFQCHSLAILSSLMLRSKKLASTDCSWVQTRPRCRGTLITHLKYVAYMPSVILKSSENFRGVFQNSKCRSNVQDYSRTPESQSLREAVCRSF